MVDRLCYWLRRSTMIVHVLLLHHLQFTCFYVLPVLGASSVRWLAYGVISTTEEYAHFTLHRLSLLVCLSLFCLFSLCWCCLL